MSREVNQKQVGGDHYRQTGIQHWDYVIINRLDYLAGNATKYVCRWRHKNGVKDLKKAEHYVEKMMSLLEQGVLLPPPRPVLIPSSLLAEVLQLTAEEEEFLNVLTTWRHPEQLEDALLHLQKMIGREETREEQAYGSSR